MLQLFCQYLHVYEKKFTRLTEMLRGPLNSTDVTFNKPYYLKIYTKPTIKKNKMRKDHSRLFLSLTVTSSCKECS